MEILIAIGERLRQIRDEMDMSQSDFAAIAESAGVAGATRQSQANYEKGKQAPNAAYLAAIAAAGADVGYILTGTRAGTEIAAPSKVSADQQRLLELVGELDEEGHRDVWAAIERERRHARDRRELADLRRRIAEGASVKQTFHGAVGTAINGDAHIGALSQRFK